MPNEIRMRQNFLGGIVEADLTATSGTLFSLALSNMEVVPPTHHMALILDPDGIFGAPEIVWVTTHNASQNDCSIIRGQEGTTARAHPKDTYWVHGPTMRDASGSGDAAWTLATYQNGWASYGGDYAPARYRKDGSGFVHIQGMVRSGTTSAPIFTLPVGYRPNYRLLWDTQCAGPLARVDVLTNGSVMWISGGTPSSWLTLDGLVFYGDQ